MQIFDRFRSFKADLKETRDGFDLIFCGTWFQSRLPRKIKDWVPKRKEDAEGRDIKSSV